MICVFLLILSSCEKRNTSLTIPPYNQYIPADSSNIQIEFDYPSEWIFRDESVIKNTGSVTIYLMDPQFVSIPTYDPNDIHITPTDFGTITISAQTLNNGNTTETLFEQYKQACINTPFMKLVNEYKTQVGGKDALVLERQIEPYPDNGYSSDMFSRVILISDKEQLYEIIFEIAIKDRGGDFEKGYDLFMNSFKFVN